MFKRIFAPIIVLTALWLNHTCSEVFAGQDQQNASSSIENQFDLTGEWKRISDNSRVRYERNPSFNGKSYRGFLTELGPLAHYGFKVNEHTLTLTLNGSTYEGRSKWRCKSGKISWKKESITFLNANRFRRNGTGQIYVKVAPSSETQINYSFPKTSNFDLEGEWERINDKNRIRYERDSSASNDSYKGFHTRLGSLAPYGFKINEHALTLTRNGSSYRGKFKWRYRDGHAEWFDGSITLMDENHFKRNDTDEVYIRVLNP